MRTKEEGAEVVQEESEEQVTNSHNKGEGGDQRSDRALTKQEARRSFWSGGKEDKFGFKLVDHEVITGHSTSNIQQTRNHEAKTHR